MRTNGQAIGARPLPFDRAPGASSEWPALTGQIAADHAYVEMRAVALACSARMSGVHLDLLPLIPTEAFADRRAASVVSYLQSVGDVSPDQAFALIPKDLRELVVQGSTKATELRSDALAVLDALSTNAARRLIRSRLERLPEDTGELAAFLRSLAADVDEATGAERQRAMKLPVVSASDLVAREFAPVRWAIEGVVPQGVTILAGPPKIGKSWLSLGAAVAVATGGMALGSIPVERGDVLLLALEDTQRRMNSRLRKLLQTGKTDLSRLDIATEWSRSDAGGADQLQEWLGRHPQARLVIVDTLEKWRPVRRQNAGAYETDYAALRHLTEITTMHDVAIIVIHHTRKGSEGDAYESVSGSLGLTGAADGALVLRRQRGQEYATLFVSGRDVPDERELSIRFDRQLAMWNLAGSAEDGTLGIHLTDNRSIVLHTIRSQRSPVTQSKLMELTGMSKEQIKFQTRSLRNSGLITREPDGWVIQTSTLPF